MLIRPKIWPLIFLFLDSHLSPVSALTTDIKLIAINAEVIINFFFYNHFLSKLLINSNLKIVNLYYKKLSKILQIYYLSFFKLFFFYLSMLKIDYFFSLKL